MIHMAIMGMWHGIVYATLGDYYGVTVEHIVYIDRFVLLAFFLLWAVMHIVYFLYVYFKVLSLKITKTGLPPSHPPSPIHKVK